jgi:pimeloyl-ACP methyl ester carboxylesterase
MSALGWSARSLAAIGAFALSVCSSGPAASQSNPPPGRFDAAAEGNGGNIISREACRRLEQEQTAVWVDVRGRGWCLRYYAFGLKSDGPNRIAAAWLHGDILGGRRGTGPAGHQKGLGPAAMVEQERGLSETYHTPFIFLGRPGAYGSSGNHRVLASTRLEADLVAAEVEALTARYHIASWVLGGHSGGGTDVAAILARRHDVRCAVISSGAPAYNAYLTAHHVPGRIRPGNLNAIDDVGKIPARADLRVIVMGDPRDGNVFWPVQRLYFEAVKAHGTKVTLLPLERGRPPEFHSLVSLAEAATGLCAEGVATPDIEARLRAMPSQAPRESN